MTAIESSRRGAAVRFDHAPELDGLRGVAVAAVVVYHFWPGVLPGGFVGVDVFFVLSGFLLSALLVREAESAGHVAFGAFMLRRIRRLLPAMLLLLVALAAYAAIWADDVELARLRRHVLGSLTYSINWLFIADGTTYTDVVVGTSPLRHVWSLAIEEQFYLLLAISVAGLIRVGDAGHLRRRLAVGAAVLAAASAALMVGLDLSGASLARTYFGTDTRMQAMLVGVALGAWQGDALLSGRSRNRGSAVPGVVAAAILAVVGLTAAEDARWMHRGGFTLVALAAGLVIVAAMTGGERRSGALTFRPLVALGVISYGVYLWHWPVLVIIDEDSSGLDGAALGALRLVITLTIAIASFHAVERPIRSGSIGRVAGRAGLVAAPVASCAVALLIVTTTTVPGTLRAGGSPSRAPAAADVRAHVGAPVAPTPLPTDANRPSTAPAQHPSTTASPIAPASSVVPTTATTLPVASGPLRLAVLGDSVAHTLIGGELDGFLAAVPWTPAQSTFDPTVVDVVSIARPACSFLEGDVAFSDGGLFEAADLAQFCDGWYDELTAAMSGEDPVDATLVLLTNDLEDRSVDGRIVEVGTPEWEQLVVSWLDQVRAVTVTEGSRLILAAAAPREDPNWDEGIGVREATMADVYARYAASHDGVETIDLGQFVEGRDVRYDGLHFTRAGAAEVARWLTPQVLAGR